MSKPHILFIILLVLLTGCQPGTSATPALPAPNSLSEEQVLEIAWSALEPNTHSHNQAAWVTVELRTVTGREVSHLFEGEPGSGGCALGPKPPGNARIDPDASYWYVQMVPRIATPLPSPEGFPPTAPPSVPEPFMYQAHLLVDPGTGQVIARMYYCVIY
jgi:hypothetical protein